MRMHPLLLLVLGVSLSACSDSAGDLAGGPVGPSTGTLVVSTSTVGDDPDPDGYQLTVDDDAASLDLAPSETAEVDLSPGRHTVRLLGVAGHCAVTPATPLEVEVASGSTTPVAFEVTCPLTAARITTTTTGGGFDPDGYSVAVDGTDRGPIAANGTKLIRLDPGSRTVSLAGLASNCAIEGPPAHTVTIVTAEVATIDFVVECTGSLIGFIWGQVLEESGVCIRGGMVEIVEGPGTGRKSGQPDDCGAWDYDGFWLNNLPLGATVTLRATAPGYQPEDRDVVVPAGGGPVQFALQPN
jgi:hypothetical protein